MLIIILFFNLLYSCHNSDHSQTQYSDNFATEDSLAVEFISKKWFETDKNGALKRWRGPESFNAESDLKALWQLAKENSALNLPYGISKLEQSQQAGYFFARGLIDEKFADFRKPIADTLVESVFYKRYFKNEPIAFYTLHYVLQEVSRRELSGAIEVIKESIDAQQPESSQVSTDWFKRTKKFLKDFLFRDREFNHILKTL